MRCDGQMTKGPGSKSSGLYGLVYKIGLILIEGSIIFSFLDKSQAYTIITFFSNKYYAPIFQSLAFLISDRYCHHMSNIYIIIPIDVGPRI